jgi:predicted phage-related endonuclease
VIIGAPVQVINVEQGTPEWKYARHGVPSASEFHVVMAKGGSAESKTRMKYMRKLVGERISGEFDDEDFSSYAMERGKAMEPEAADALQERLGLALLTTGFWVRGGVGASPDRVVAVPGNRIVELKTRKKDLQVELLLDGRVPSSHTAQIQGELLVTGAEVLYFASYSRGLPLFMREIEPDRVYHQDLQDHLGKFEDELQKMMEQVLNAA